ncbi:HET-domain-containing protein, partial [Lepidopterella palustris CBS 459.81]
MPSNGQVYNTRAPQYKDGSPGSQLSGVENSYEYHPLDLSMDEIRLLTLHPGKNGDKISCTISHHNLKDNLKYEALSYTWGDNENPQSITINGYPFRVRANLETALRHLRYPQPLTSGPGGKIEPETNDLHKNRVLWVDALCINQQDHKERGHQVRRMNKIFSSAWRVLAWLGETSDDSDTAMDFIN